jgi:hypothetical protein
MLLIKYAIHILIVVSVGVQGLAQRGGVAVGVSTTGLLAKVTCPTKGAVYYTTNLLDSWVMILTLMKSYIEAIVTTIHSPIIVLPATC